MLSNILVPLDGSTESNAAVPLALTLAQDTGGAITLLRVVKPHHRPTPSEALDELRHLAAELAEGGPRVDTVVREADHVAREILTQIGDRSAHLVIMRTHGRAGVERAVLGSVTQEVVAASLVPVILVRPGDRHIAHIRKLLVPVDGSPGGTLALAAAAELSRSTSAVLSLLEVSVPTWVYASVGDAYGGMGYYDPDLDDEALGSARTYVDAVATELRESNVVASGQVCQAPRIADAIVKTAEAESSDMIVMSTRALTGPARALLGSTADAVVRTAHCPVMLIHRTDAAESQFEPQRATEALPALT